MYNVVVSTSSTLHVLSTVNYDNMRVGYKHHACEYTYDNSMIALTYFIIQTDYLWSKVGGQSNNNGLYNNGINQYSCQYNSSATHSCSFCVYILNLT